MQSRLTNSLTNLGIRAIGVHIHSNDQLSLPRTRRECVVEETPSLHVRRPQIEHLMKKLFVLVAHVLFCSPLRDDARFVHSMAILGLLPLSLLRLLLYVLTRPEPEKVSQCLLVESRVPRREKPKAVEEAERGCPAEKKFET